MASIVAFRYTEKYKPLLGGKEIPVSQMNFNDEIHAYSNLYKGYTTVAFCGMKKWDDNCYVIYDGVKYTTVEKLYAAIENKKNLAILDTYL